MHLPLIVTLIMALPLDQVLQAVVTHWAIQYSLDHELFLTIDESWGWGWHRSLAKDGIGMCKGQLDHGEDWVEAVEVEGESQAICAIADTGFNDKGA
jgi:thiamine monophosphate kinase